MAALAAKSLKAPIRKAPTLEPSHCINISNFVTTTNETLGLPNLTLALSLGWTPPFGGVVCTRLGMSLIPLAVFAYSEHISAI